MQATPFDCIKQHLASRLPSDLLSYVPDKWEKIGDVVTVKFPDELSAYQEMVGKAYAEVLRCKTVLNDVAGITGVYRQPTVEVVYGSVQTETIHLENGVRFKLDPQKIMFSSGNMDERKRMARISHPNETVVDLFAGIGYFSIPMARYSTPKKIIACEINPVAFQYLSTNVVLNHVTKTVFPVFGDNQKTAPRNCADRVLLGCINETHRFLPLALDCLKNHTGILHYHDVFSVEDIPEKPLSHLQKQARRVNRSVGLLSFRNIKSYAPGIAHVVLDVRIGEQ